MARDRAVKWAYDEVSRGRSVEKCVLAMVYQLERAELEGNPIPPTKFIRDSFEVRTEVLMVAGGGDGV
ncbi:MAG: hypothetical protein WC356_03785 [Candidatus Micrarchaeia archaeon]